MADDALSLSEAHLDLLDHVDEDVHIGIMLPGGVPWAGGHGTLRHEAQRLIDDASGTTIYLDDETARLRRRWAELLLGRGGREGRFMVGDFVIPLGSDHVLAARRTSGLSHPGLDFTIGAAQRPLTVRVTFAEHERHEDEEGDS